MAGPTKKCTSLAAVMRNPYGIRRRRATHHSRRTPKWPCSFHHVPWWIGTTMPIIAQLSDLHLSDEDPRPLDDLRRAIAALLALPVPPGHVVLTGDLADHGRPSEYAALRGELAALPMPVHPLPGNHDDVRALLAAFPELSGPNYTVDADDVRIACCDST